VNSAEHCSDCTEKSKDQEKKDEKIYVLSLDLNVDRDVFVVVVFVVVVVVVVVGASSFKNPKALSFQIGSKFCTTVSSR